MFYEYKPPILKYFDKKHIDEDNNQISCTNEKQTNYEKIDCWYEDFFKFHPLSYVKELSKEERENKGITDHSYVYGEVTYRSMAFIFEFLIQVYGKDKIIKGDFLDLGSVSIIYIYPYYILII